ncbi:interferon-related developmental regulator 2 [Ostrinia furnacalis]|uniref:interferon-related developmental regulator 2 n=1 Tax=Ostrinia furnacalis TaxID=93504 RepID=UPI00103953AC|nr:interferon-related developmental regulator 2 [Ostrinia furnacalis]
MPKGRKKGSKHDKYRSTEQPSSSDEDAGIDMTIDNCSEISAQSDSRSNHDEAATESEAEKLDEKVLELIDNLTARSAAARATALGSLRSALQRRYLGSLLENQRATLADLISRAIRKGRDAERKAAAAIAPLLSLQIGEEGIEEFVAEVRPALTATCVDRSASLETRTECCSSLAVLCYLMEEDVNEIVEIMKMYETIFSRSYLKGDGSVKVSGPVLEEGAWHAAALDAWALLLSLLSAPHAASLLQATAPAMARFAELMAACSLEVRLAAGSAVAIAHECTGVEACEEVLARLGELAKDSHKFRAKRDRKVQRATFRDILKYMEEDEVPELAVRVGTECIWCTSWGARACYGALAGALGGGLAALAPHSPPLRHALGLADAPVTAAPTQKLNKLQRHLQNSAASKARTLARNKTRDKRTAALVV